MSASILSATANPTGSTRRRPTGDVRQTVEILNGTDKNGVDDTKFSKDLSHSIRGETILERSSKETLTTPLTKRSQSQNPNNANNTPVRSRNRRVSPKPVKPRWVTVLRVLVKNLLLLGVVLGLVQMVRRFVIEGGRVGVGMGVGANGLMGFSEMEGRIAQVESSMKTTSKMLQVQVEVVDKKIESLVGDVRRDMSKRIEDRSVEVDTRLREVEERGVVLEAGLNELKSKDLLSKEDLMRFYDELKNGKGNGGVESEMGLDQIRVLAREIVEKEIEKHAADGLGRVDYALASGGATVVKHSEALVVGMVGKLLSVTNKQDVHSDAGKILKPSFGEPGQCFPLKGSSGFVQIRLRTAINPEAITLEHVDKSVAFDRSSAPKHCRVSGWMQGWQRQDGLLTELASDKEKPVLLTEFTYNLEKSNAQTFDVFDSASSAVIDTVRFDFSTNHGNPSHTCIYRLRVHGREPTSIQIIASDS